VSEYQAYVGVDRSEIPPLHPTLAALSIVLHRNEDLGTIDRSHPDRHSHKRYKRDATFPDDISDLLPPHADRWWEKLGKS
jgi:hypothetical protein